jgi:hypothetical protein
MARSTTRFGGSVVAALFAGACLLGLSAGAVAHPEKPGKTKNQSVTVTGCLQKGTEQNGFFVTDDSNRMWELSSKSVALAQHVGHQVTVTGVEVKKSKSVEAKSAGNEKTEASGKPYGDLSVKSLKMVSETCGGR